MPDLSRSLLHGVLVGNPDSASSLPAHQPWRRDRMTTTGPDDNSVADLPLPSGSLDRTICLGSRPPRARARKQSATPGLARARTRKRFWGGRGSRERARTAFKKMARHLPSSVGIPHEKGPGILNIGTRFEADSELPDKASRSMVESPSSCKEPPSFPSSGAVDSPATRRFSFSTGRLDPAPGNPRNSWLTALLFARTVFLESRVTRAWHRRVTRGRLGCGQAQPQFVPMVDGISPLEYGCGVSERCGTPNFAMRCGTTF